MNNNNDKNNDEPLVVEPEDNIGKLDTDETDIVSEETQKEGLLSLLTKISPMSLGVGSVLSNLVFFHVAKIPFKLSKGISKEILGMEHWDDVEAEDKLKEWFNLPHGATQLYWIWAQNMPGIKHLLWFLIAMYGTVANLLGYLSVIRAGVLLEINKDIPTQLASPDVILSAVLKYAENESKGKEMLEKLGLQKEAIELYWDAIKQIAPLDIQFQNLWRRENWESKFTENLKRLGYDADQQDVIQKVATRIPPIQDIIRFAVREAFHDELSAKFQHDAEFPEEVAGWAEKQGFPEYWARMYWRAHWQLPSIQMAFEMLHRRVKKHDGTTFVKQDIYDLLKMQDYPIAWRDLLTQISYRVITRVDARRMYRLGVWDNLPDKTPEQAVYEVYLNQGYNPDDAKTMTEFTVEFTADQRRALTTTGLKRLRKRGLITEQAMRERLAVTRVHEQDIEYVIDETNYEIDSERLESFLKMAKAKYLNRRWDKAEVMVQMSKHNINVVDKEVFFEAWDYDRDAVRRVPTKADILRFLEKGLIEDYKTAIDMLMEIGYNSETANLYIEEVIVDLSGDIKTLYKIGYIKTKQDAINHLIEAGYLETDATAQVNDYWSQWTGA